MRQKWPHYTQYIPYNLPPLQLEILEGEIWTQPSVAHTIKALKVIGFRCTGILHIANFLILSTTKLLTFNVGCHFNDGFSRKPSQTSYRPTNSNQSNQCQLLVLCAIEHSFSWMRQPIAMKAQLIEDSIPVKCQQ